VVTRFYGIRTGVRKVSVPNIIGISKTQARINLSNIDLTYLEQTTPGTVLSDNDIVSAQNIASGAIVPKGSIVQYTYKVFTFTPPYFPPFFPPFFPPHFPPFFPPFFPPHFPPFFPPFFPPHFPPFFPPFFPPHFPPFFPPFFPPHFPPFFPPYFAAETWGPCTSYQVIQPTCNGEDVYQGIYQGTRRTSSLGNVEVCSGLSFIGFGSCIASNNRSCGGSGPDGPC
jgi:hypothetical protein